MVQLKPNPGSDNGVTRATCVLTKSTHILHRGTHARTCIKFDSKNLNVIFTHYYTHCHNSYITNTLPFFSCKYTVSMNTVASRILCVREQVCFPQSKMVYAPKRFHWQSCNDACKGAYACFCACTCATIHLDSIYEHLSATLKRRHVYSIGVHLQYACIAAHAQGLNLAMLSLDSTLVLFRLGVMLTNLLHH